GNEFDFSKCQGCAARKRFHLCVLLPRPVLLLLRLDAIRKRNLRKILDHRDLPRNFVRDTWFLADRIIRMSTRCSLHSPSEPNSVARLYQAPRSPQSDRARKLLCRRVRRIRLRSLTILPRRCLSRLQTIGAPGVPGWLIRLASEYPRPE